MCNFFCHWWERVLVWRFFFKNSHFWGRIILYAVDLDWTEFWSWEEFQNEFSHSPTFSKNGVDCSTNVWILRNRNLNFDFSLNPGADFSGNDSFRWILADSKCFVSFRGFSWFFMVFHGFSWFFMVFHGVKAENPQQIIIKVIIK